MDVTLLPIKQELHLSILTHYVITKLVLPQTTLTGIPFWEWVILNINEVPFQEYNTERKRENPRPPDHEASIVPLCSNDRSSWSRPISFPGCLSATSLSVSLMLSPLVTLFCRRRSSRLSAVVGGLVLGLGVLFTSFATEFSHLYFSHGTVIGA